MTVDVVIAGAGIVGAACARELAQAGMSVVVVEADLPSSGATGAGMGHIVVMDDSEAEFRLTRYSQQLWLGLSSRLPPDVEYHEFGTIWVAVDDEEMQEVHRKHRFYASRDVRVEVLGPAELAEAEPNLRPGLAGGLLVRDDSVIYPPNATRFLLDEAAQHGARLMKGTKAATLDEEGATLSDGTRIRAGVAVNATGASAAKLTPAAQVFPRKGHLLITDRYPGFVRHQLVELGYLKSAHATSSESVAFNVQPRITGQALIGSSRKAHTSDPAVEPATLSAMLRRAIEYMPAIATLSGLRTWTGFRAATPDGLPLIGPCPGCQRVFLATGHEGLGITTCLATAAILRAQITGTPCPVPMEPYLPERAHSCHA